MLSGMAAAAGAAWPRVPGQGTDWVESLSEPQWPAMTDASPSNSAGGPRWPAVGGEVERRFPSPFAFEIGARYWYSRGTTKFGFTNGIPGYGSPTSTLDWNAMQGHSGEVFARVDHQATGLYMKATVGAGILRGGEFIDRDYIVNQYSFSDTTSQVHGDNLRYATVDIGMSYELPRYGTRIGGFVGYHYWHEKTTAYGLVCNADDFGLCNPPGQLLYGYDTAVITYEPTWSACAPTTCASGVNAGTRRTTPPWWWWAMLIPRRCFSWPSSTMAASRRAPCRRARCCPSPAHTASAD